jgi:hypothetical protein
MPESDGKAGTGGGRPRADGRRALLLYMTPDLIKGLKKEALDEDRTAYEIVEELVGQWLTNRGRTST